MKKIAFLFVPLLALVLAACAIEADPTRDIYDVASSYDEFNTLETAIDTAELDGALQGDGPFTLFAPTNDAIAAALELASSDAVCGVEYTAADLLADPALGTVLGYHVVAGLEADAAFVIENLDGADVSMLAGGDVTVNIVDGGVVLTDALGRDINVIRTDLFGTNGVVHVIDGVLLPTADLACPVPAVPAAD
jgi:uncharacterized surface protein with fasciclin (FAS1) repeats